VEKTAVTTPENARNPEQQKIIQGFLDRGEDPFDRKNIESIGNIIVAENKFWYCIINKWPLENAEKHLVIVSKKPVTHISELEPVDGITLLSLQQRVIEEYRLLSGAWCMRFGDSTVSGATCTRLHGHLMMPEDQKTVTFYIGKSIKKPQ